MNLWVRSIRNRGFRETQQIGESLFDGNLPFKTNAKYFLRGLGSAAKSAAQELAAGLGTDARAPFLPVPISIRTTTYAVPYSHPIQGADPLHKRGFFCAAEAGSGSVFVDIRPLRKLSPSSALIKVEQLLAKHPEHPILVGFRATCLSRTGRHAEAEALYQEIIRRNLGDTYARNGLANLLVKQDRLLEAKALYLETTEKDPKNSYARNGLAGVLAKLGRLPEAEDIYREVISIFPENDVAYCGLAEVVAKQGRSLEALEIVDKVLAPKGIKPYNIYAAIIKCQVLFQLDSSPEECCAPLQKALKACDYSLAALKHLRRGLYGLGTPAPLMGRLNELISSRGDHRATPVFGSMLYRQLIDCLIAVKKSALIEELDRPKPRVTPKPVEPPCEAKPAEPPRPADPKDVLSSIRLIMRNKGKRNFVSILRTALEQMITLAPQSILGVSSKSELQEVLSFLAAPPRELKREFKELDVVLLKTAKGKLIAALQS